MSKYIDADKLIAEIEKLLARANRRTDKEHLSHNSEMEKFGEDYWNGYGDLAYGILGFITSLQQEQPRTCKSCGFYENGCPVVRGMSRPYPNKACNCYTEKEVELEKEIENYFGDVVMMLNCSRMTLEKVARHFYELGLNAKKEVEL